MKVPIYKASELDVEATPEFIEDFFGFIAALDNRISLDFLAEKGIVKK